MSLTVHTFMGMTLWNYVSYFSFFLAPKPKFIGQAIKVASLFHQTIRAFPLTNSVSHVFRIPYEELKTLHTRHSC